MQYRKSQKKFAGEQYYLYICNTNKREIERVKEIHKNLLPISPPNK